MDNPLPLAVGAAQGVKKYSYNQEVIKLIREGALAPYVVEREAHERYRAALWSRTAISVRQQSSNLPKIQKTKIRG